MLSRAVRDLYQATIGIECHVQLKTKSKLFSAADNDAREAPPNTLINHIDFGLPGALPVLNEAAVRLACKAAFALGTEPQLFSKFDRKHYFYPDLPMGYQITQYDQPIILGGQVEIQLDGTTKTIGITRAHLEADAGKSTHPAGKDYSLVDLNRAGTPLLEIVSEPDMHSGAEAKAYARELYLLMKYAGVSEANLYYGNMRFDVNVSVTKTDQLGIRTETKNINSFRAVEKVVDFEINRQIEQLEKGQPIVQETRGWDDAKQRTFTQRTKENADDYRYMPEPDVPPIVLDENDVQTSRAELPVLPPEWRSRLKQLGLDQASIETLIDAEVEEGQVAYLPLIELLLDNPETAKFTANRLINVEIPLRRQKTMAAVLSDRQRADLYREIYRLSKAAKISSSREKELIDLLLSQENLPESVEAFAEANGFLQLSDEQEIKTIVQHVITDNPKAAEDVRQGEMKAIGFLVGQVMKLSAGKANPQLAQRLLKEALNQ